MQTFYDNGVIFELDSPGPTDTEISFAQWQSGPEGSANAVVHLVIEGAELYTTRNQWLASQIWPWLWETDCGSQNHVTDESTLS